MKLSRTSFALLLLCCLLAPHYAMAQKYACVNSEYVLKNMPDYLQAQERLNKYANDWQKEIEAKYQELEQLQQNYQQESYLLPDNLKQRRQQELKTKDQEIRDLQRQRFGAGGDLDKKRQELLKPVEDRVYSAIERLANEKNYAFVFDRAGSATVLFANEKYDLSDQVLEMLGYKPGDAQAAQNAKDASDKGSKNKSSMGGNGKSQQNNSSGNKKQTRFDSDGSKNKRY